LHHLRRVLAFRFDLPRPGSRALPQRSDLPWQLHRIIPHRLQGPVRLPHDPEALLIRKASDFQFVPVHHRLADSLVPARLRVFVRQPRPAKRVLADRVPVCHCDLVVELQEDILSAPAARANEVAGPVKDLSEDNALAQPAEQEFQRLSRASRFMRANRPRRAVVP
jgi:hypothetical protein